MFKILNIINELHEYKKRQRGAVLMVMLVILILGGTAMLLSSLNSTPLHIERDKITAHALAQAKEALIGYATTLKLTPATYPDRPGDLPCPDTNNDGVAEGSCGNAAGSTGQTARLGRLPWKTLGLGDLRDGSGERLWYAVSNNFKKSTRTALLNSDTVGTITVRAPDGSLLNDGSNSNGAVAIIIAPGNVLQRSDKPSPQDRSSSAPENYLDIAYGEDNATFTDSSIDGFIQGRVKDANNHVILNDQILVITRNHIMQSIQKRVVKEVVNALNKYYCGDTNVNPAGGCLVAGGNRFYPRPAGFTDNSCLGNNNLASCNSAATTRGRIPATPATAWSVSSILRGSTSNNWFQANGWREVMFYAVANACTVGTFSCNGSGYLTLNNPAGTTLSNQKVVVIATGSALSTTTPAQARSSTALKTSISNYLEDENLSPLDDIYTKSAAIPFNDIAISIP